MSTDFYTQSDGLALAEMVRSREVSPLELVEAAIQQIETQNPELNAVVQELYDDAKAAAKNVDFDAPFCGVPFLLKDLTYAYAGAPLVGGSNLYRDYIPDYDSEIVVRFKKAGVLIVGKTSSPEFGLTPVTEPQAFGPTINPWDRSRTPGGSSGGAAASVAARMVPIAHASDGGGSIRIPASCCGLFGLKPTRGRTPQGPRIGEGWQGFVATHVLSRSVRDSAAMLDATHGPDPGAITRPAPPEQPYLDAIKQSPGKLRIAYTAVPLLGHQTHPDCVTALEQTVKLCEELGHELIEATPDINADAFSHAFMTVVCAETRAEIEEAVDKIGRKARPQDVEPASWVLGLLGKTASSADLVKAQHVIHGEVRKIGRFFEDYDMLLTPTLSEPPLQIGALQPQGTDEFVVKALSQLNISQLARMVAGIEKIAERAFDFVAVPPLFNASGQPAMSVPLYWNEAGLPVGLHFVSHFGQEDQLLQLAAQLEEARPWADRMPPRSTSTGQA